MLALALALALAVVLASIVGLAGVALYATLREGGIAGRYPADETDPLVSRPRGRG